MWITGKLDRTFFLFLPEMGKKFRFASVHNGGWIGEKE